jgi:plasmid stabilization system protein ParE
MVYTFRTTEEALRDLNEAARYIAQDTPNTALRFIDAYIDTCELLAGMPEAGSLLRATVDELREIRMFRVMNFTKYLIFYRPWKERGIEVIRVIHAARDYPTFFDEEET